MKKAIFFVMGGVLPFLQFCAQPASEQQAAFPPGISIGERCPDIPIHNILNYPQGEADISTFRGKVVILDFFATWCSSCIAALPHLDTLQQKWGDKLQVLVVDREPAAKVKSFLENNPIGRRVKLPFVTDDTLLNKAFPHAIIPHEVWIGPRGTISAITQPYYVNDRNIQTLLAGRPLHLPIKRDVMDFDRNKPLLVDNNGGDPFNLLYRSVLTRYLDGLGTGMGRSWSADSTRIRLYYINQPLLSLYAIATGTTSSNRVLLEVSDSSRYIRQKEPWTAWARQNSYCYELTVPANTPRQKIGAIMLQELNRYLDLQGRMEERNISCWALVVTGKPQRRLESLGGKPVTDLFNDDRPVRYFCNQPLSRFVSALNYQVAGRPLHPIILNETSYTKNVDLRLRVRDIRSLPDLDKALKPYGLGIKRVMRRLKMFVLSEKDSAEAAASRAAN